ncbi:hypothetical protein Poli38472_010273 [Pythium oligandrum]|uniref:non-specific serine/threonine protein kinase n=1 Tax=Pythium oligandrum TaxID=41045 RepID=A0A8K1C926_PYTOL|nr:hypothetical protein Poli38472_010273 [Pythium oligandrum]|eukprot:TMW58714.1 hypothetical protein Poli38472_010273 [Pythium oligandrum]
MTTVAALAPSATSATPSPASALLKPRMLKHFQVEHTLGAGLQGKVKLGINTETQERVALKIIDTAKLNRKAMVNVYREVEAMSRVQHPYVLRLLGVFDDLPYVKKNGTTKQVILIVLELATGGELFDFMMYTGCFSESIARAYFQQLVSGLEACHQNGVYHRDIKPENLLLDDQFALKIADFGLSGLREGPNGAIFELYTQCGTRSYMSPEVLSCMPYEGEPADVWSVGVVLFIMLAGFPPFQIATRQDWWFRACAAKQYEAFWAAHERSATFSPGAKALLTRIFSVNPQERITLQEIKSDPWVQEITVSAEEFRAELVARKQQVEAEKHKEREQKRIQQQEQQQAGGKQFGDEFDPFNASTTRSVPDHDSEVFNDRLSTTSTMSTISTISTMSDATLVSPAAPLYPKECVALYTSFQSRKAPVELQARVEKALTDCNARFVAKKDRFKTKAVMESELVSFAARIYTLPNAPERCVVEFRRTSGNCFQFQNAYKKLMAELADLVWDPKDDTTESESAEANIPPIAEEPISDDPMMI